MKIKRRITFLAISGSLVLAISACSSSSADSAGPQLSVEEVYQACIKADADAVASGDKTFAGVRPASPKWPPYAKVYSRIYDTGVIEVYGTTNSVKWDCLWHPKTAQEGPKLIWGA